ncbi:hypothetical protein O4214_15425 [Rhodococcus erythropolis]|uniref:AMIN-like domain-containing (lipo)protein n=1 Tax=Rhodococcus erythropolis TaxID=1833 RepID=UPI001E405109|nr:MULTISPECIES: hypothetical protein [Rhodococcus erythropolis group]MCD2104499.1 hypothetical protein [Rhodococcus qingshengii]MCZ4525377.1 hypothetical protein [Rhodococcus erythropolis]
MNVRRVITLLGAMSFLSLLAGCQTDDESDTAGGSSTQVVLDAATRTGTLQVGSRPINAPATEISMLPPLPNDTEIPSPNPPVDVSEIDVTDHEGFTRITYRFDGNGPVFWKTEYVSEAIRAGDSTVVDVGSRSILQVDLMGVRSHPTLVSAPLDGTNITRMERAGTNDTILQSFVGTLQTRPAYTVSTSDSPSQLTIDIPAAAN